MGKWEADEREEKMGKRKGTTTVDERERREGGQRDELEPSVALLLLLAVRVEARLLRRHEARRLGSHEAGLHRHLLLLLHREACQAERNHGLVSYAPCAKVEDARGRLTGLLARHETAHGLLLLLREPSHLRLLHRARKARRLRSEGVVLVFRREKQ